MLRIIFQKYHFIFEEIPDFMKIKQSRSDITSRYQPVARLDLCYVSENEGFGNIIYNEVIYKITQYVTNNHIMLPM